jgi:hypothetical protein
MMNSLGKDLLLISLLFSLTALSAESSFDRCENPQTIALIERAKAVIDMIMYQNLATVDEDGEAWIAPVYSAFDDKYNFYWKSSLTCQHSKNIRFKSNTFTSIYDSTVEEGTGFGVYMRGNSYQLEDKDIEEINHGIALMEKRVHSSDLPPASDCLFPFPRRVYKFVPQQIWVNAVVTWSCPFNTEQPNLLNMPA